MMNILEDLLATLPNDNIPVHKVIIGVHWTLVSSKYCGLGSTMVRQEQPAHSQVRDVGHLQEKSAQELASWVLSDNLLEASIGIAALNSLLELHEETATEINAAEIIALESQGKNLAIIGHFPFVDRIKPIAKNCWVIEKKPFGDDFPEEAAKVYIPQADVIAITGTAFINHTIEGLIELCPSRSVVMVLGPSTPLSPLLFNYGITYLSGSRITDEGAAIKTIQQGASFPQVQGVKLCTLKKESSQL
jgi:uncharacterized protein (DUF4213/DUF364 family)